MSACRGPGAAQGRLCLPGGKKQGTPLKKRPLLFSGSARQGAALPRAPVGAAGRGEGRRRPAKRCGVCCAGEKGPCQRRENSRPLSGGRLPCGALPLRRTPPRCTALVLAAKGYEIIWV